MSCPSGCRSVPFHSRARSTTSPSTGTCWRPTAGAAGLVEQVSRPDLLLMAALLHDIGKGSRGDHAEVGAGIAGVVCSRMGFAPDDASTVSSLVEHHLLLRDVASRRDIDDPATVQRVVSAVGSIERLRLLAALTEADAVATSATAWDPWTAQLTAQLVDRVAHQLRGWREAPEGAVVFPTADQLTAPALRTSAGSRSTEMC